MIEDYIRYDQLVDKAMRNVVKDAIKKVQKDGFSGKHHFLVSFLTEYKGVHISQKLKNRYPEEMTIVLQHQYEDLQVSGNMFSIVLSFDGKKEQIKIPFGALTSFADPGVKFGLKFNILFDDEILDKIEQEEEESKSKSKKKTTSEQKKTSKTSKSSKKKDTNVVSLETFRNKDE